jgi:soluble lytic murein transglycosylase
MAFETLHKWKWWVLWLILVGGALWLYDYYRTWAEDSQDIYILAAAQRYRVDPALVKAVVWRESRFNPNAKGTKQERGLMQIRQPTAEDWVKEEHVQFWSPDQLFDPGKNTLIGTWYLKKLLGRYPQTDNPAVYALADYNAGRTHVLRWNKGAASTNSTAFLAQMDYPGTRKYVRSILKRYEKYRKVFPPKKDKA